MLERWRRAGLIAPTAMALAMLAVLIALGSWQLERKAWKERLITEIAARTTAPPTAIGEAIFATASDRVPAYTHVRLRGTLLHDKERYWFSDGRLGPGFHVFTPLEVAPHRIVWIDRGYIPSRLKSPATRREGQVGGIVELTGLVHLPGDRNAFTPANDVAANVWYWRDLSALNASAFDDATVAAPVMVDADANPATPGGWPEGGATLLSLPNRHLEYVLTWYGLALALIGVFFTYAWGRLNQAGADDFGQNPGQLPSRRPTE